MRFHELHEKGLNKRGEIDGKMGKFGKFNAYKLQVVIYVWRWNYLPVQIMHTGKLINFHKQTKQPECLINILLMWVLLEHISSKNYIVLI